MFSAVSVSVFGFPSVQGAGAGVGPVGRRFRFPVFVGVTAGASDVLAGYPDKPPEDVVGASVGTSAGGLERLTTAAGAGGIGTRA